MPQAIHFISIGGSAMHNLARSLQQQGYVITGSDDEINEPSRTRLQAQGLLPVSPGWFPEKIHAELDGVIVGMHAKSDNPELVRAQELGLPIYSYPEFVDQLSRNKQRIVIAGSHGKTTITAMILHALTHYQRNADYVIGAVINGFDSTVRLTNDKDETAAPIIILEADEFPSSPIDTRPKFLQYQPHIALISGISWDHVAYYPTWETYVDPFESLAEAMPKAGILIFDESDDMLDVIGQKEREDITKIPYQAHPSEVINGQTYLITRQKQKVPVQIFGEHNMKNIAGAMIVCDRIGITEDQFYEAIPSFGGVSNRLEKIAGTTDKRIVFRDIAHAPAQVEAATQAVKAQYPAQKLFAVLELSASDVANSDFLEEYKDSLKAADAVTIYANATSDSFNPEHMAATFGRSDLRVFTDTSALQAYLLEQREKADSFLFMSSATFGGLDLAAVGRQLV
ncbi:peptidoglycan synthetase [Spirosoma sp. BT702]|uniref:Peptidoglycan synthetase n=1 Tax=Spirosoma profusum TaxID=2771354 RepID=A0A926Y438_9BACT|nr:Mur ligase family protein [Spirosoma profusum]MBD2702680.1 peptidoglycan synthetase [Spirosoma profusum]